MTLSPDEIERRSFTPSADGYHQGEVRAFLQRVADEHRAISFDAPESQAELGRLTMTIAEQEQRLSELERRFTAVLDRLEDVAGDLSDVSERSASQLAATRKVTSDQKNLIAQMAGQVSRARAANDSLEAFVGADTSAATTAPAAATPAPAAEPTATTPEPAPAIAPTAPVAESAAATPASPQPVPVAPAQAPIAAGPVADPATLEAVSSPTIELPQLADTQPAQPADTQPAQSAEPQPSTDPSAVSTYSLVSPTAANTYETAPHDPPVVPAFSGEPIPHRTLPGDPATVSPATAPIEAHERVAAPLPPEAPAPVAPALDVPPVPADAPTPTAVPQTPPAAPIAPASPPATDRPLTTITIDEERRLRGPAPAYDNLDQTPHITDAANSLLDGVLDDVFGQDPGSKS